MSSFGSRIMSQLLFTIAGLPFYLHDPVQFRGTGAIPKGTFPPGYFHRRSSKQKWKQMRGNRRGRRRGLRSRR